MSAVGRGVKRLFDIVASALLLILLAPLMLCLAVAVAYKLGRPVMFSQPRPGLRGRIFTMLKFRSMLDSRDIQGRQLSDGERLTPFGRWLRSTSLDELPEVINVLRGEMSLVGPRPLKVEYLERYDSFQARRHEVKPGITGWAQVNGRNRLSWEEKFSRDVWYVDNQSLMLDLRVLLMTVIAVFDRGSVSAEGHDTMPEFRGADGRSPCPVHRPAERQCADRES